MSPLEDAIQEQKSLKNKGYSVEDIQCAALMVIADKARQICNSMETLLEYADNATDN